MIFSFEILLNCGAKIKWDEDVINSEDCRYKYISWAKNEEEKYLIVAHTDKNLYNKIEKNRIKYIMITNKELQDSLSKPGKIKSRMFHEEFPYPEAGRFSIEILDSED